MGFRKSLKKLLGGQSATAGQDDATTRWDKAAAAMDGIAQQVAKIDPDGIDVYCFPGSSAAVDRYRNVIDSDAVHGMIASQEPAGACRMADTLNMVFADIQGRASAKPCSMLVITAGQPDDEEAVISSIQTAVREQHEHLSITFVHVGDDPDAETFLRHLDDNLKIVDASGTEVDIVDTVKDEEIRTAMAEMRDPSFRAGMSVGALLGAFAGMAVGAGGAYLLAKKNAEKRTAGWNGKWEVISQPGDVATGIILRVVDDMQGNLAIEGYPEDGSLGAPTVIGRYSESDESYAMVREVAESGPSARPPGSSIIGSVVDEHYIEWSDNTAWREVPPEGASWEALAGAGTAGAVAGLAAGGALGRLTQKKFFNKAANKDPCDYVIVLDRSIRMQVVDNGPGHC